MTGSGGKVLFVQFLKNGTSSEIKMLEKLGADVMTDYPEDKFLWELCETEKENICACCRKMLEKVSVISEKYDMIVLDEIFAVISAGFADCSKITEFINSNQNREIVLTGRNAPAELIAAADYVSDIKCIKHPMEKGIFSRKGIEY